MSDGYCKVTILGNLGEDPSLRFGQNGGAVLNMRVAVNTSYVDKDKQRKERVDWYSLVVFGKRAEGLSKILRKGSQVFAEGDLRTRSYDDKEGVKRTVTEIHPREIIPCGGKRASTDGDAPPPGRGGYRRAEGSGPRTPPEDMPPPPFDDDCPF